MAYRVHVKDSYNGLYEFQADGIDLKEYPGCVELVINGSGRDIIPLQNIIFIEKLPVKEKVSK